ncbi:MAG: DUF2891 domain-containing protein [Burkholderiales bacterium]
MDAPRRLTPQFAAALARMALANVVREYPNHPQHVLADAADLASPRTLHPAFYGSYDWHSCVHMHWLLARVRRRFPAAPEAAAIAAVFDAHLTPANVAAEAAYFARPLARTFERTYGWAWLLRLAAELAGDATAARWADALAPLTAAIVERFHDYLPRQRFPLRQGLHPNSAFGLALALDYAAVVGDGALATRCREAALRWFAADRGAPAAWEPSGADFLSPALVEADLMRRVLDGPAFAAWLGEFLPGLADGTPASLLDPVPVDDRADPLLVHLDGLNLARAWSLRGIAGALRAADPRRGRLLAAAGAHLAAGLAGLESGEYAGEHWLATFALLALDT